MIKKVQELAHSHRGKLVALATAASVGGMTGVSMASGATATGPSGIDYSTATTSVTGELTSAAFVALPIAGTLIAVMLGWKYIRRFLKV